MSFNENLKDELEYCGTYVKEIAAKTGISKKTIDNYLRKNGSIPTADKAVAIAEVLGVSVEYLVTGKKQYSSSKNEIKEFLSPEMRTIADIVEPLDRERRKIVVKCVSELVKLLQEQNDKNSKTMKLSHLQKVFIKLFS
jgi:transcriptional regulator with XRE-family HTH domain